MKHNHLSVSLIGLLTILGGFLAQPATAGISISISSGHHYGTHHKHTAYRSHSYKRDHYYQRSYSRKHYGHSDPYRTSKHYRYQQQHGYKRHLGKYDCHTVTKWAYDNYGRKLKIGGTMCYDHYGQAYVAPGSRYVIHQY